MKFLKTNLSANLVIVCLAAGCCGSERVGAAGAPAESLGTGLTAGYHLSKSTGLPLRPIDLSPFKGEVSSEILASPATGLQGEFVLYTRLAPGARKRGLYTLPTDHT